MWSAASPAQSSRAGRRPNPGMSPRPDRGTPPRRRAPLVQCLRDQADDVAGHGEVDVAGELDEAVGEIELAGTPGEVVRIDRDAMPAHTRAGRESHEPERLGRRRVDDLPDVEAH